MNRNIFNYHIKVGENKRINIDNIVYILTPDKFASARENLGILHLFTEDNKQVRSYVIIKELGFYYAYESPFTTEVIKKRISKTYNLQ